MVEDSIAVASKQKQTLVMDTNDHMEVDDSSFHQNVSVKWQKVINSVAVDKTGQFAVLAGYVPVFLQADCMLQFCSYSTIVARKLCMWLILMTQGRPSKQWCINKANGR